MCDFFKLLETAKTDRENIFRKIRLLAIVIARDPQFVELNTRNDYAKQLDTFNHPNLNFDVFTTPGDVDSRINEVYVTADRLIDTIRDYIRVKKITNVYNVTTTLQELISRSAF